MIQSTQSSDIVQVAVMLSQPLWALRESGSAIKDELWKIETSINPEDISLWAYYHHSNRGSNTVLELCLGLVESALKLSPLFYSDLKIWVANDKNHIIEHESLVKLIESQKVKVETALNRLKIFISDIKFHDCFHIEVTYNGENILYSPLSLKISK